MTRHSGDGDAELQTFVQVVRGSFVPAVFVGVALAAAAYFASQLLPPRYEATATLSLTPAGAASGASELTFTAPPTDANAYVIAAESLGAMTQMLVRIGVPVIDPQVIKAASEQLEVSVARGDVSDLLIIKATAADPQGAADMANALASVLVDWDRARAEGILEEVIAGLEARSAAAVGPEGAAVDPAVQAEQESRYQALLAMRGAAASSVHIATPAEPPLEPAEPRPLFAAVVAFVTGTLAIIALNLLRPALTGRFRGGLEAADKMGLPLLGEFRRGSLAEVDSESVRKVAAYAAARIAGAPGGGVIARVVAVASPQRSDAAPAFALGLAVAFADLGKSTLFIDADLRNPLSFGMPVPAGGSLNAALRSGKSPQRPLALKKGITEFHVIPASPESDDATALLATGLPRLLDLVCSRYEVIVLNTTPLLAATDALTFLDRCDDVVLIVDGDVTTREDASTALDVLAASGGRGPAGVVFTSRAVKSRLPRRRGRRSHAKRIALGDWDVDYERSGEAHARVDAHVARGTPAEALGSQRRHRAPTVTKARNA